MTTCKSQYTTTSTTLAALARFILAIKALYSASLLVVGKSSQTMHSTLSPSRLWITTPASPVCLLDDPTMWILHLEHSPAPWPSILVNFAMKSATTCPFMAVHKQYYTSNSFSSIAHRVICPVAPRLLIALRRGLSIRTIIV